MVGKETDINADISAVSDGANRGESVGLMEPLLIAESSRTITATTRKSAISSSKPRPISLSRNGSMKALALADRATTADGTVPIKTSIIVWMNRINP